MKIITTFLRMIRYKSALVLIIFMLLSILVHDLSGRSLFGVEVIWMILSFLCMYACAAFINDLADVVIDKINLKGYKDRPLVTGAVTSKAMLFLAIGSAVAAVLFARLASLVTGVIAALGILLNIAYSVKPLRISYRPALTPFYLTFCYVAIPFAAGFSISGARQVQWIYFVAFYLLFLGRISLKDLRDRKGDAAVGKPTLVLKYGKRTVVTLSTLAICGGSILLMTKSNIELRGIIFIFWMLLMVVEYKILTAKTESLELLSVGYGARMGNGLLFAMFGTQLLVLQGATLDDMIVFYLLLITVYGWMFVAYVRTPQLFYFGKQRVRVV